jgi:glycosyltransferase involved in cell wall biosynthesis
VRPFLNRLCLALPAVQRSLRAAQTLLVSNHTTLDFLPAWCRAKARVVPPNAIRDDQAAAAPPRPARSGDSLVLLYLGNFIATRSIPLVLAAMREAREIPVRLTIAGDGPALAEWQSAVAREGLADRVDFPGRVPLARLPELYARTDALVFPGLRDSGGSSLLEAMSLGVPVICLDWAGPSEVVESENGVKVPVTSPRAAIDGLAAAFRRLFREPAWGLALGAQAAADVRRRFTWEHKREVLEEVYAGCLKR